MDVITVEPDIADNPIVDNYIGLLNSLGREYKTELLKRLNHSILEEGTSEKTTNSIADTVNRFCGAWQSDKDADEIITEIKAGRRNRQQIVNLYGN
jgi:hypothetical protein